MLLIIDRSEKNGNTVAHMMRYMGILAYEVTPAEAFAEISPLYSAVLLIHPETLPDGRDFLRRLAGYCPIPVFVYGESDLPVLAAFPKTMNPSAVAGNIRAILETRGMRPIGSYYLSGLDADISSSGVRYFDRPLTFTRTEVMMIRYLIRTYPALTPPLDILRHAFRRENCPDLSNIRTHVSVINKKFREATGQNLIQNPLGRGYCLITPIEREIPEEDIGTRFVRQPLTV